VSICIDDHMTVFAAHHPSRDHHLDPDKRGHILVCRLIENAMGRADLPDPPIYEHCNPVAEQ
jgi:hypothetical protein